MLNFENISFLPRINGLFSLLDRAHKISTGVLIIFIVILAIYAVIPPPSIPQKCIFGREDKSIFRSFATDFGMILQSAPVSTRKSYFWYPYFVKTGMGITGSGIIPNCVRLWPKGNLECIDADSIFWRNETDSQRRSVYVPLRYLFYKLCIGLGMRKNFISSSCDVFAGIIVLKFCIRDSFHMVSSSTYNLA